MKLLLSTFLFSFCASQGKGTQEQLQFFNLKYTIKIKIKHISPFEYIVQFI